jgi:16S rRNA (adenine1518-N6/adenine1519-N6)-dimethyltransferase
MPSGKSLGQHFLIDRGAIRRIVTALALRSGEPVLEIGPGKGALTGELVRAAGRIAAVEIDPMLALRLRQQFDAERLFLFEQDVLRLDLAAVLDALGTTGDARLVLAGNLPYRISKPVAQMLIRNRQRIDRAVLMFQQEVARRMTAAPGGRNYGPLSILLGLTYRIEMLFDLPPRAFSPRPGVVSTVTRWRKRVQRQLTREDERRLRTVLAGCFARRRRTLRNNLRAVFGDEQRVARVLAAAGIDGGLRAEAVPPDGFLRLAALWDEAALL